MHLAYLFSINLLYLNANVTVERILKNHTVTTAL